MSIIAKIQRILDEEGTEGIFSFIPLIPAEDFVYNNACFYDQSHVARIWVKGTRLNVILSAGGYSSITYYSEGGTTPSHTISLASEFRSFFPNGDNDYLLAQQQDNIVVRSKQSFALSITNEEDIVQGIEYPSLQYIEYGTLEESVYAAKTILERDWVPWIKIFSPTASNQDLIKAASEAPKNIVKIALNHANSSDEVHVAASLRA